MDSARQTLRWALPGLLFVFFWLIFVAINWFISKFFDYPDKDFLFSTLTNANQLILPLTLASVPCGFLIYQIYYFFYWKAPIPGFLKFFIDSPDRGRYILKDVENSQGFRRDFRNRLKTPPDSAYVPRKFWRDSNIMREYLDNWHLSDAVWYVALKQDENKSVVDLLEKRNQMLADIYHTLGVSYFSLFLAFLFYLALIIYVAIRVDSPQWYQPLAGGVINIFAFRIIFASLKAGRQNSYEALTTLKRDIIYAFYNKSTSTSELME